MYVRHFRLLISGVHNLSFALQRWIRMWCFRSLCLSVFWAGLGGLRAGCAAEKEPVAQAPEKTFMPESIRQIAAEGNAAFAQGEYGRAQQAYRQVLKVVPRDLLGLVNLGRVELQLGHEVEAEKLLKRALQEHLESAPAWLTLGILYYQNKKMEEAWAALTQAVFYDPGNPRSHNYLGVVLGVKGWWDGAESELRRAIELDPHSAEAHYNLALVYLRRHPPAIELAKSHYERSKALGGAQDALVEEALKKTKMKGVQHE